MEYVLDLIGLPEYVFYKSAFFAAVFLRHIKDHFVPHPRNNYHPHILGHRTLALFSALLVSVKIFTLALVSFGPILPALSSTITDTNIISLTNQSREQFGLKDLTANPLLTQAAQAKANDMLAKGYFSHNTPDGRTPWNFITAAGYNYLMAGENLAVNFVQAEDVETAWMNSPDHKANILNANFEDIGIGVSEGDYQNHTAILVVQMFGTPAQQNIQLTDKPTQVQATAVPAPTQKQPTLSAVRPAPVSSSAVPSAALLVKILSTNLQVEGSQAVIDVQTNAPAVKVLAFYGQQAIMLDPKSDTTWKGSINLSDLANHNAAIKVQAFGMRGDQDGKVLADFSGSTVANYNLLAPPNPSPQVNVWGKVFNPKTWEQNFYLLFIAAMLSCLILAIAIRKHIQHVTLVANTAFVVILAVLFWVGG